MSYTLHPGAERDVENALDFYREQAGRSVAERFLEEFEYTVKLLVKHPHIGTPTTQGRRAFPLKIFPHLVVYRNLESGIRILIVRHQHRKPGYAGNRR